MHHMLHAFMLQFDYIVQSYRHTKICPLVIPMVLMLTELFTLSLIIFINRMYHVGRSVGEIAATMCR